MHGLATNFWPTARHYAEAVQCPAICFEEPALKRMLPAVDRLGMPLVTSGQFAYVFKLNAAEGAGEPVAVRCFRGYLGDRGRFPVGMDVSQDGDTEFFLNLRENCEGSLHLQSHECQIACPIGFPVGRLEDERHPELVRDILNALGGLEGHLASFDDAGTGDEDNRIPPSDSDLADSYHADFRGCRSLLTPPKYKKM